jgi:hypothetical protein
MTLAPHSRLGPYEIVAPIGAGGMGAVYRAKDPRLGRDVAIKVLPASFFEDADRLRRFEQEARAAGALNHPGITAVFDVGTHDGAPYLVQELLEGETLRAALASGRLSPRRAVDDAVQIAQGLAAAHEKGIVHRDLKPENLFVTRDGRVKILDFGLAKLASEGGEGSGTNLPTPTRGTEPGVVLGTLGYMSPEQVRGRPADARSDDLPQPHRKPGDETARHHGRKPPLDLSVQRAGDPAEGRQPLRHDRARNARARAARRRHPAAGGRRRAGGGREGLDLLRQRRVAPFRRRGVGFREPDGEGLRHLRDRSRRARAHDRAHDGPRDPSRDREGRGRAHGTRAVDPGDQVRVSRRGS